MGDVMEDEGLGLSPAEEAIVADLRAAFLIEPDPDTARRHVAAMVAAREARQAPSVLSLAAHRSRKALVAAGLAGAVVLGSAGVAAASGSLPDSLQRVVASVGRPVGIHLPVPAAAPPTPTQPTDSDPTTVAPSSTTATDAAPTTVPGGGQAGDDPNQQAPASDGGKGSSPATQPSRDPRTDPRSDPNQNRQKDPKGDPKHDGGGSSGGGSSGGGSSGGGSGDGHGGGN